LTATGSREPTDGQRVELCRSPKYTRRHTRTLPAAKSVAHHTNCSPRACLKSQLRAPEEGLQRDMKETTHCNLRHNGFPCVRNCTLSCDLQQCNLLCFQKLRPASLRNPSSGKEVAEEHTCSCLRFPRPCKSPASVTQGMQPNHSIRRCTIPAARIDLVLRTQKLRHLRSTEGPS